MQNVAIEAEARQKTEKIRDVRFAHGDAELFPDAVSASAVVMRRFL